MLVTSGFQILELVTNTNYRQTVSIIDNIIANLDTWNIKSLKNSIRGNLRTRNLEVIPFWNGKNEICDDMLF